MGKIFYNGFIVFSLVLLGLLYFQVTKGIVDRVFPIQIWFFLTLSFGLMAIIFLPSVPDFKQRLRPLNFVLTLGLTLLLVSYVVSVRLIYGAWELFVLLVTAILPWTSLYVVRSLKQEKD